MQTVAAHADWITVPLFASPEKKRQHYASNAALRAKEARLSKETQQLPHSELHPALTQLYTHPNAEGFANTSRAKSDGFLYLEGAT